MFEYALYRIDPFCAADNLGGADASSSAPQKRQNEDDNSYVPKKRRKISNQPDDTKSDDGFCETTNSKESAPANPSSNPPAPANSSSNHPGPANPSSNHPANQQSNNPTVKKLSFRIKIKKLKKVNLVKLRKKHPSIYAMKDDKYKKIKWSIVEPYLAGEMLSNIPKSYK